ncbi:MAG: carboxypeptidase-like regulatory domain-containing protein [Candidatus Acidiferrum sp.]
MKAALLFLAVGLLTLASTPRALEAQRSKGSSTLTGVVIGPNDRPVPHASITYQTSDGSAPHATHADAHGHFVISHLPANDYDIRASAKGIFSDWQKNISLRRGQTKSFELRLIYAKEMPKSESWQKPKS